MWKCQTFIQNTSKCALNVSSELKKKQIDEQWFPPLGNLFSGWIYKQIAESVQRNKRKNKGEFGREMVMKKNETQEVTLWKLEFKKN